MDLQSPLLIFDGDCSFCRLWIAYWKQLTGERVAYRPFQEVAQDYPDFPRSAFERSVQLVLPDGTHFSAARAVFRLLAEPPGSGWLLWLYEHLPGFAWLSEWVYALIAAHRDAFYRLTAFFIGRPAPVSYRLVRWLYVRAIGLIYLFAFGSLTPQIKGLIGQNGILPVGDLLGYIYQRIGPQALWRFPTVFWLNHSDGALVAVTVIGSILAVLVVIGVGQRRALIVLFGLYLSLLYAGQDFLSFQWDTLLLEAGFLAILLAPGAWLPHTPTDEPEPPRLVIWLVRWLLFRLMFGSGMVKLLSGDVTWRSLTALDYHFFTQPLPTPLGWVAAQLPTWAHAAMTAGMFGIELGAPFLIFFPRRVRFFGAYALLLLQVVIALTGNFSFFNLLAMAMCLALFDDSALSRILPARLRLRFAATWARTVRPTGERVAFGLLSALIVLGSGSLFASELGLASGAPGALFTIGSSLSHYGLVNTYGLFAVMTTSRPEIIVEGSNDGVNWLPYEFPFKAGDVRRAPPLAAPYQPRLDWQMWFAALGSYRQSPWFANFMFRLLQGSPDVLGLLEYNPFPGAPPHFIRARLYVYRFSTLQELSQTGVWWDRSEQALYFPEVSLDQFH